MNRYLMILGVLIMGSCSKQIKIPKAEKKIYKIKQHGDVRNDNYYWMRLTDEQKLKKPYDSQTKNVLSYIEQENNYTDQSLLHTEELQNQIFDEIVGRIKKMTNPFHIIKMDIFIILDMKKVRNMKSIVEKKAT